MQNKRRVFYVDPHNKKFLIFFIGFFLVIFANFFIDQINFIRAISWPANENYTSVVTDSQTDGIENPNIRSDQLDLTKVWAVNNKGVNGYPAGFYVKIQVDNIHHINKGNRYEFYWNPSYNADLFYKVTVYTVESSAPGVDGTYTVVFWKSVDQKASWTKLAEYAEIKAESYNLTTNSLGYNIKSIPGGYVEIRVNESLFDATTTTWYVYAKTTFGSAHIYADRNPDSGNLEYTFEYNDFTKEWPEEGVYKNLSGASPDPVEDYCEIPPEQQEIYQGYFTDTFHNIFAKVKLHTIPTSTDPAVGMSTEVFLNASGTVYSNIWYAFKAEYAGSNKWDLWFRHSTDNQNTWIILESHSKINLTGGAYVWTGEYNSGTLGLKVTAGSPGYIEWYTKKQYIEEPTSILNLYYETVYGSEGETVDRTPNSGSVSYTLNEPIDQLIIDPPNLAPETTSQGEINVPMTILTMRTIANTVEWTGLRIDRPASSTMEDIDVDKIKIWKDDGDQILETGQDMLVAEPEDPFVNGVANFTLNPTQILTTASSSYFITYDIDWFAGLDRTVGMEITNKTYFTVSAPDNVSHENFPFIAGNSKIISGPYLSFYISGINANTSVEGVTTTISTGGAGWINFGSLIPNIPQVAVQRLNVVTNSQTGYQITIEENQNLTDPNSQNTIPDVPGTNASPAPWPPGGGFGYHTSDDSLRTGITDRFLADDTYAAITINPEEVAYHGGAILGQEINIVYKLEIDPLQSLGNYINIVSYICTTTY